MSIFKRLSATVVSGIDSLVGEIEDHNAVVEVAIRDLQKQIAAARVRFNTLEWERDRLLEQVGENRQLVSLWKQRAVKSAESGDEEKALECLGRARNCEARAAQLEKSSEQFAQTARKLKDSLGKLETSLQESKQKQSLMRAREASGKAIVMNATHSDARRDLTDTFERWEINLLNAEMYEPQMNSLSADENPVDHFEEAFVDAEKRADLQAELAALMKENDNG
jgi:phage shock protein A